MQALQNSLVSFFEQVARRDKPLLRELAKQQAFALSPDRWLFTLPDLFSFLQKRHKTLTAIGYKAFRRAIYAAPINAAIKNLDAEIVIDQNHGQVDKSVYALRWRTREEPAFGRSDTSS